MAQRIVTVTVSPTVVVPRSRGHVNDRAEVQIYNGSGKTIYIGSDSNVTAGTGTPTSAGMPVFTGAYQVFAATNQGLWAVCSTGTADINCLYTGIGDL